MIEVVQGPTSLLSQWSGLPVIFDEVFVGLYHVGTQSKALLLGAYPNISLNAKILMGGLMSLAVTSASDSIFCVVLSKNKVDAPLHWHSYTAHPIGCEVANETLKIIGKLASSDSWKAAQEKWVYPAGESDNMWSFWDPEFIHTVSHMNIVSKIMTLGTKKKVHPLLLGTVLSIKIPFSCINYLIIFQGYVSQSAQTILQSIKLIVDNNCSVSAAPELLVEPHSVFALGHLETLYIS